MSKISVFREVDPVLNRCIVITDKIDEAIYKVEYKVAIERQQREQEKVNKIVTNGKK